MADALTTREAGLRTIALAGLVGLALVQVLELPWAQAQGRQLVAVAGVVVAVALGLARALVRVPAAHDRLVWPLVAAAGGVVLTGWALTRAVAVPGSAVIPGRWLTGAGLASAALAAALVVVAAAALPPRRPLAAVRAAACAVAVGVALLPPAVAAFVALGPAPHGGAGHESAEAHGHAGAASAVPRVRPGFGGHAGRYVYPNATPPRLSAAGQALGFGGAALLVWVGAGRLRRRVPPAPEPATRGRRATAVPAREARA